MLAATDDSRSAANPPTLRPRSAALALALAALTVTLALPRPAAAQECTSGNTVTADVVAMDQPIFYNRLGAFDPVGMIFALRRDVVSKDGTGLSPGNVKLRDGVRPRPLVLRVNEGECLEVEFENLLDPEAQVVNIGPHSVDQPATRTAGFHVVGMQLVNSIDDDGSNVGTNDPGGTSGLVDPGGSMTYTYYAAREGGHLFYSSAATTSGEGNGGTLARGLFGSVNVEPPEAEYYRNQLTREDMELATVATTPVDTAANGEQVGGQPIVDYDAVYPDGHEREDTPILKIRHEGEILYGDLNAIITGPDRRNFGGDAQTLDACDDAGAEGFPKDTILRNRCEPFREFTVIFHDEIGIAQAFDIFEDPVLSHTLHSGRDAFAINYGTGGIGAEIAGNRLGVGPMWDCNECKYEEFFLSSWSVGDPATPVDIPANADLDGDGEPDPGPKATKALYPRDPSNVHHSYINDHVKMRNLHAGPKEHHIFHLHAHQWVTTPDDDESTYLDSQAIGPGSTYTYEIAYDGGGNRPKTPGDAIFHCHFYPHFAQGMWELWRVHDVLEPGTQLDEDGRPVPGGRALPDGEIAAGIPIPAVVPLPGKAMPPMPTEAFPGYPFYIPGIAGHRPPKPPLDTPFDGGLPRHVVQDGLAEFPEINRLDWHKDNIEIDAVQLPEEGTELERNAMDFHAAKGPSTGESTGLLASHETFVQPLDAGQALEGAFRVNGLPPIAGAPYADPCVDDFGRSILHDAAAQVQGDSINYKSASLQIDAIQNKAGWHFPQHRMFSLWDDVASVRDRSRAPEPLYFRANTNHCITYELTNLIPKEYKLDDFQVLTPTDVIGQHIHLVKFDVTSSDGAANGFNYEDGAFAFDETQERVEAIRTFNECSMDDPRNGTFDCPEVEQHPFFDGPTGFGAQINVQRWFADDVLNNQGQDRTLRTVFTHDHFGPSTHQQAGLYAGLVAEPEGSEWFHNETGVEFGTRFDGGPTSWQAVIHTPEADSSFREFNVQLADFGLGYFEGGSESYTGSPQLPDDISDPDQAVNPAGVVEVGLPFLLARPPQCPGGPEPPCPELISADDPGAMVVNYRNEPLALRVRDPDTNEQASEVNFSGDLSAAFSSLVDRADDRFDVQPDFYPDLTSDLDPRDPFTSMFRAFEGDRVQVRILVGAHEEGHNFNVHGVRWLFEPSWEESGYRNTQMMGISEHFEFDITTVPELSKKGSADFLWAGSQSQQNLWTGTWGLMRVYKNNADDLQVLPSNPDARMNFENKNAFSGICPEAAPEREFDVTAVLAKDALDEGTLVYNPRTNQGGKLHDPTAILYVQSDDLDQQGKLKPDVPVEPLILRANAGDCIELTLRNELPDFGTPMPDLDGFSTLPMIVDDFNNNQVSPSRRVGLHPQLLSYDVLLSDGAWVGRNKENLVDPGKSETYTWYAGILEPQPDESMEPVPVEFGATNLVPSDRIQHAAHGAVGSLVIEPEGATWALDDSTRHAATVTKADGSEFREFAVHFQTAVNMRRGSGDGDPIPNLAESEDPEDSGQKAFNYRAEPFWKRMGFEPDTPLENTRQLDFTDVLKNSQVGGEDPVTPVFTAEAGEDVRFRVLNAGGKQRNSGLQVHGHVTQHLPYVNASTELGDNPLSEWKGVREGMGPLNHFDYLLEDGAGGPFEVVGDYLYRDQQSFNFDNGLWGILRVVSPQ